MTDTFKGIITADGKKRQLPYGSVLETPVSDETLSVEGGFADAKVTGDKFKEVKAETDSLKEDITRSKEAIKDLSDKKITKFYASNLVETTLNDSDNGKITDMKVYGKSFQKQYTGKNLLKNEKASTTITLNGGTFSVDKNGIVTVNGTFTADTEFTINDFHISTSEGGYYLVGCPNGGGSSTYYLTLYNSFTNMFDYDYGNGSGLFQLNKSETHMARIVFKSGVVANNLVFKPMLTTKSSATYDDFEPYVGGIPSPNPDYPQEIQSVVNPVVKVCGKNLLKPTLENTTLNGITCTNNGDGTYTLNGTANHNVVLLIKNYNFEKGINYKLVGTDKAYGSNAFLFIQSKGADNGNGLIYESTDYSNIVIGLYIINGSVCNNLLFKPMLTTDLNATYDDFVPYKEQSATIPITLNAIPVSEGGNITVNGQQYIADYVDIENKKLVRMVGEVDLGTLDWSSGTDGYGDNFFVARPNNIRKYNNTETLNGITTITNLFVTWDVINWTKSYNLYDKTIVASYERQLAIRDLNYTDTTSFKNAMSGVKLLYELATPTITDLTDKEVQAFKDLATYYPTTNVMVTSDQLDGYTTFNYPISLANGWNYVKEQLGDTREYIYDMELQSAEAYVNSEYAVTLTELGV